MFHGVWRVVMHTPRYRVVTLHFTNECNLNCPICYRRPTMNVKPFNFWIDSVKYLSEITKQVALGGGEPFLYPDFVSKFAKECREYDIIPNVTTNGKCPIFDLDLFGVVSVSYDPYKWSDFREYLNLLEKYEGKLACNYLLTEQDTKDPDFFIQRVENILKRARYIYLLHPKLITFNLTSAIKELCYGLALLFKDRILFDDGLLHALKGWNSPCHYGQDVVNINPDGSVTGCSFDPKPLTILEKPSDIIKLKYLNVEPREKCPFM